MHIFDVLSQTAPHNDSEIQNLIEKEIQKMIRDSKFGKTEELFNSLWHLCFAEERVAKMARAL